MHYGAKMEKIFLHFMILFWPTAVVLAWTIPNIDLPTYTYQCMPMELRWYDGSPPYSVWFRTDSSGGARPVPGLGAWFNLTGTNFVVPCAAPAGKCANLQYLFTAG
jgi:hypothetical protein